MEKYLFKLRRVKKLKTIKLTEAAMLSAFFIVSSVLAIGTGIGYSIYLSFSQIDIFLRNIKKQYFLRRIEQIKSSFGNASAFYKFINCRFFHTFNFPVFFFD